MKLLVAFILLGVGRSFGASFGADKTQAECRSEHSPTAEADLLSGHVEPRIFRGPTADCHTDGCTHGYWGPRCRFEKEPTCPPELRRELGDWLRHFSGQGSKWARDALFLQPCDLWEQMRGHTLWVLGDSMQYDIINAVTCFMVEYLLPEEQPEVTFDTELLSKLKENAHNKRLAVECKQFQGGTRTCYLNADRGPSVLQLLELLPMLADREDTLIINVGIHYADMGEMRRDIDAVAQALADKRDYLPWKTVWRESTAQHFGTFTGMPQMDRDITLQRCAPLGAPYGVDVSIYANGSLGYEPSKHKHHHHRSLHDRQEQHARLQRLLKGGERNLVSQPLMDARGIPTLRVWNISAMLDSTHTHIHVPGEGGRCTELLCDCTHSCAPSGSALLLAELRDVMAGEAAWPGDPEGGSQGDWRSNFRGYSRGDS